MSPLAWALVSSLGGFTFHTPRVSSSSTAMPSWMRPMVRYPVCHEAVVRDQLITKGLTMVPTPQKQWSQLMCREV